MKFKHSAIAVIGAALASVLIPPEPIPPSKWAKENLVVPDGPKAGERWDADLTAYIEEPLDMLGPDSGVNEIAVMKSAQTGFTTMLIAKAGHVIDRDPCKMMIVQPTDAALSDFVRDKLNPAIEQTPALAKKVRTQTSRSGTGSTTYSKRFPGGSITLAIATSAADLSSKTVKILLRDEIDRYPDDLDGQGDPIEISDGRLMSFLEAGDWKKADISTPTLKGASKIAARFEAGDRRYMFIKCPGCAEPVRFERGPSFKFEPVFPHKAYYVAPCCGQIIENHQKRRLVREAVALKKQGEPYGWQPTATRPGAFPSYHFDTFSSPFVPWDEIAKAIVSAGDDPAKMKTLWNLWFGLPYEMTGDAPDHTRLMERREDLKRGTIPPWGLLLVGGADVQMRGIYYEILALAPNRESWVVDAGFLDGDTSHPEGGAFAKLTEVYDRSYPDAFGGRRRVDAFGVDSGYLTNVVYTWCRHRPGAMALKGADGWSRPAIGTATLQDVNFGGKKVKKGVTLWSVGTWPLKATFYSDLRKEGRKAGQETDPPGYCHFGTWQDEIYFKQITSEYLADERFKGRVRKVWTVRMGFENHLLDCRIYNMALAEYLGLSRMTPDDWAILAKERGVTDEVRMPDLLASQPMRQAAAQPVPSVPPEPVEAPALDSEESEPAPSDNWLSGYELNF